MAFPVAESLGTAYNTADTATTAHNIDLPGSLVNDELILVFLCGDAASGRTYSSSDLTEIFDDENAGPDATLWVGYRKVDGTEGSTVLVTGSHSEQAVGWAIRISGWDTAQAPEVSTKATGASVNPDSSSLTPTGGAIDRLWFSVYSMDIPGTTDVYPLPDTNNFEESGGSGAISGAFCSDQLSGASLDPTAFTVGTSREWIAATVSVNGPGHAWDQEGYRWRNDDGSESAATWHAAQDTDITDVGTAENIRFGFLVTPLMMPQPHR